MNPVSTAALSIALALSTGQAGATDIPRLNAAFQDHIAYVATFSMPVLIDEHQDQIERGRLLTLAELEPGETLRSYREHVLASRLASWTPALAKRS